MAGERGTWSTWSEFLFAALGAVVGLGNIWRFPFICYRSGGGAFIIPYMICLLIVGMPMMLLETSMSQYSALGPAKAWVLCPLFRGVGMSVIVFKLAATIYYIVIVSWTLYYFGASFQSPLPWTSCNNSWNTENCLVKALSHNFSDGSLEGGTNYAENQTITTPEEEFWFRQVQQMSDSIEDFGGLRWRLVLCLVGAWAVVVACLFKGIKSLGKVAYVTSSLPYVILGVMLIRSCLLPGAADGLYYYAVPQWDKLLDVGVWRNALAQMMYSLGLASGGLSTLASYNRFNNNCLRDAYLLPTLDALTSLYAGTVVFACIGYMSHIWKLPVDLVVDQGPGLVFITYPAALSTLPLPQLWSALFFLMLFNVGLNTEFVQVQVLTTALTDLFPKQLLPRKSKVNYCVCFFCCLMGLPFMSGCGIYIVNLLDWYFSIFTNMLVGALEAIGISWLYGVSRLMNDICTMIGYRPPVAVRLVLTYVTPTFMCALWLSGLIGFRPIGSKYAGFPPWSDGLGYFLGFIPVSVFFIFMALELGRHSGPPLKRLREALKPGKDWKPQNSCTECQDEATVDLCVKS